MSWLDNFLRFGGQIDLVAASSIALTEQQALGAFLNVTGPQTTVGVITFPSLVAGGSWTVRNGTTGSYGIRVKGPTGLSVGIAPGGIATVACDGTNFYEVGHRKTMSSFILPASNYTLTNTQGMYDAIVFDTHDAVGFKYTLPAGDYIGKTMYLVNDGPEAMAFYRDPAGADDSTIPSIASGLWVWNGTTWRGWQTI